MSADATAKTTTFSGCNLYLNNGLGATNGEPGNPFDTNAPVVNGLGNLIIGYNESRALYAVGEPDVRTGSHNLIVGDGNNYASYGGIVGGRFNATQAPYASVSGGRSNTASGVDSSVSGGLANTASYIVSTISGGDGNTASGLASSVSGGAFNSASGDWSSILGGNEVSVTTLYGHSP
jgi:hypothetical protein